MKELVKNIGKLLRQRLSHFGTGILRSYLSAHLSHTDQRKEIPLIKIGGVFLFEHLELLNGVVNESCELCPLLRRYLAREKLIYLLLDYA